VSEVVEGPTVADHDSPVGPERARSETRAAFSQREYPGIGIYHEVGHASVRTANQVTGKQGISKTADEDCVFQKTAEMFGSIELRLKASHCNVGPVSVWSIWTIFDAAKSATLIRINGIRNVRTNVSSKLVGLPLLGRHPGNCR
jgi:hypothetical protein